ncbi:hypothetical protein RvY_13336-3 [Ramazzottius varieornatus]|uniref:Cytochrome P450 n=1 Tax=Ramazzottius varieornatus TaxID=947166 RepID=A0A1D1VSV0_RAMVA|nr:hypothetical protein RvY_13336-3 [Ramazzottius varieornatus]
MIEIPLWWSFGLILFVSLLAYYRRRRAEPSNLPPGPACFPLIGNLGQLRGSGFDRLRHMAKLVDRYGKNGVATLQLGAGKDNRFVFIKDYETIKHALGHDAFSGRPKSFTRDEFFRGQGILFVEGYLWKEHRRFALSTLRDFGMGKSWLQDMILDEARELVDDLTALKENPIDPTEVITPCANNVICGIAYGKRFSHQDARLRRLTELIGKNLTLTAKGQPVDFYPFLRHIPFTKFSTVLKECTKNNEEIARFLQDLVDEHRKVFRPSADAPSDYIDAFLKQQYTQRDDPTSTFTGSCLKSAQFTFSSYIQGDFLF